MSGINVLICTEDSQECESVSLTMGRWDRFKARPQTSQLGLRLQCDLDWAHVRDTCDT